MRVPVIANFSFDGLRAALYFDTQPWENMYVRLNINRRLSGWTALTRSMRTSH
jgi:hypothetical protein